MRGADQGQVARHATVTWRGGLADGGGQLEDPAGGTPMTWPGRAAPDAARPDGATSPEQLIAAAHAGCYSMSMAAVLGNAGLRATRLEVRARCVARLNSSGLRIEAIELTLEGVVPGLDPAGFDRMAAQAERQCPVSNSLRGNVEVRVTARLLLPDGGQEPVGL